VVTVTVPFTFTLPEVARPPDSGKVPAECVHVDPLDVRRAHTAATGMRPASG